MFVDLNRVRQALLESNQYFQRAINDLQRTRDNTNDV